MSRLAPGTPVSGPYASYTAEQLAALEAMKDRTYSLGVARAEFANTLLCPDGSPSSDVVGMINATKAALSELLAGDLTDPATLDRAKRAAEKVQEVVDHVALGIFLFVVNADQRPVVYFQAAVDGNPNLPPLVEDHEAHAAHLAEVGETILRTIEDAHAAAAAAAPKEG